MSAVQMEDNYTLEEAARHLRMHIRSVRNEINRGNLAAFRAGRRVLISASEIELYKQRNRIQPAEIEQDEDEDEGEKRKKVA